MLSNLPPEIILICTRYLYFDDVEQMAWVNKYMMGIVKRNLPLALMPKMQIITFDISSEPMNKKNEYKICFTFSFEPQYLKEAADGSAIIRPPKESRGRLEKDQKLYKLFWKYHRYCIKELKKNNLELMSWKSWATQHGRPSRPDEQFGPILTLHLFLARAQITFLQVEGTDEGRFWYLLDELCTVRSRYDQTSVHPMFIKRDTKDFSKFNEHRFFENPPQSWHMTPMQLNSKFVELEKFAQTLWYVYEMNPDDYRLLKKFTPYRMISQDGVLSLKEFIPMLVNRKKLLLSSWTLVECHNLDEMWGWEAIHLALCTINDPNIAWTVNKEGPGHKRFDVRTSVQLWVFEIIHHDNETSETFDLYVHQLYRTQGYFGTSLDNFEFEDPLSGF